VVWYHGVLLSGIYYLRFSSLDPRPGDGLCYQGLKKEGGCNDTILHLSLSLLPLPVSRGLSQSPSPHSTDVMHMHTHYSISPNESTRL